MKCHVNGLVFAAILNCLGVCFILVCVKLVMHIKQGYSQAVCLSCNISDFEFWLRISAEVLTTISGLLYLLFFVFHKKIS